MAAWLAFAGAAAAQTPAGQPRSTFVPRSDAPKPGLATLVVPAQAKTTPGPQPDKLPAPPPKPGTDPKTAGKEPEVPPVVPPKAAPGIPPGVAPGIPPAPPAVPDVGAPRAGATDPYEAYIRLEPPGKERLFGSRDTERELEERMRQERKELAGDLDPIVFPEKPELTTEPYQPRRHAPLVVLAEPSYVVYQRLYFEEKNSERYGWDMGPVQPVVSSLCFFKDVLLFPHNCATDLCRRFETSAGQCLPGDPVPYIVYPPELSESGLLAEVGAIALLFYAIP